MSGLQGGLSLMSAAGGLRYCCNFVWFDLTVAGHPFSRIHISCGDEDREQRIRRHGTKAVRLRVPPAPRYSGG